MRVNGMDTVERLDAWLSKRELGHIDEIEQRIAFIKDRKKLDPKVLADAWREVPSAKPRRSW
jgi:hypothetical protein